MSWSFPLGRIAGTEVRIHITFFLLLAWFGIIAGAQGDRDAAAQSILFILAVFACVLAHEFGHVLMARRFGIGTRDITLLPIGGVANIEKMPDRPGQELLIAVAGPVVNVGIVLILVVVFGVTLDVDAVNKPSGWEALGFLQRLAIVNAMLVLFNLLPAFPMDGGRVLRALLSMRLGRMKATRVATRVGQAFAFGLGFLGLFGNPLLIVIAFFVFLAASQEAYAVELDEAAAHASARQAAITSFTTLDTQATVGDAVNSLLATSQHEFPVVDGAGKLRGVVTRDGMIKALSQGGPQVSVIDIMERDIPSISCRAPLTEAIQLLHRSSKPLIGVLSEDGSVKGIITYENLAEYMLVAEAGANWTYRKQRAGGAP